jgi:hypothetical protein
MICGFPYESMCATAQKVVPKSMPIAFRVAILEKLNGAFARKFRCRSRSFYAELGGDFVSEKARKMGTRKPIRSTIEVPRSSHNVSL